MQIVLFGWIVSSAILFSLAFIMMSDEGPEPGAIGRVAILAVFWPLVAVSVIASFVLWHIHSVNKRKNHTPA